MRVILMMGKYAKNLIIRLVILIGVFVLVWFIAPQQREDIKENRKVELRDEKSVGGYDGFNDAGMMGLDERIETCVYATGSEDISFISYADWTVRDSSWVDAQGNPYLKVGYKIDTTSKGNKQDADNKGTFVTTLPKEMELLTDTLSVSHSYMTVSLSNNNRTITVNWTKNLGYNRFYVVYVCKIIKSKVPADIRNGSKYFNTNGETIVQPLDEYGTTMFSAQGCAYVKTGGHYTYLLSSPAMKYKVNTEMPFLIQAGGTKDYGWTNCRYGNAPYFMKVNHQDYDTDGNKHYRVNLRIDTTSSQIQNENITFTTEIPAIYDYVGDLDVNDPAISYTRNGRKFQFVIQKPVKKKVYYMSFETKIRIADIPASYFADEDLIPVYTSGNTYDYNNKSVGMTVTWGNYGTMSVGSGGVALPIRGDITYYLDGGTINSGKVTSYRYGKTTTLPTNVSKQGYTFGGWLTYVNGGGEIVTHIGPKERGNKTYWAVWNDKNYKVTLHANGGTIKAGCDVTSYMKGVGAPLPTDEEITKTGYTFVGWYDNEDLNGIAYTKVPATAIGNKEYWAKWESSPGTTSGDGGYAEYLGTLLYVYGNADDWTSYYSEPLRYVIDCEPSDDIYTWLSTAPGSSGTQLTTPQKVRVGQSMTYQCPPAIAYKVTKNGNDVPVYAVIRYKEEYLVHVEGDPDTTDDDYSYWDYRYVYDSVRFTMRFKAAQALG